MTGTHMVCRQTFSPTKYCLHYKSYTNGVPGCNVMKRAREHKAGPMHLFNLNHHRLVFVVINTARYFFQVFSVQRCTDLCNKVTNSTTNYTNNPLLTTVWVTVDHHTSTNTAVYIENQSNTNDTLCKFILVHTSRTMDYMTTYLTRFCWYCM
jgi:hypothetical protein